jgi:N4-gp56 family major capsid protein
MALTTTTEITAPVNVLFQSKFLRRAESLCCYFKGSSPATVQQHQGTFTAKWRRMSNLTPVTASLTELSGSIAFPTRQAVQPSVTDITATVAKFGNFIYLNEEIDLLNYSNTVDEMLAVLATNAGQSLNRQQRNTLEDNLTALLTGSATTATGLNGGSTASANIKRTDIQRAVNTLARAEAMKFMPRGTGSTNVGSTPIRDSFWGFVHVDTTEDLRALTGFNSVETYAGYTETAMGEIGHIGGVRFIETTESSIDTGSGHSTTGSSTDHGRAATAGRADVYNTVILGRDCHGSVGFGFDHIKETYTSGDRLPGVQVIQHPRGSAGAADPLNEVSSLGWKSWHAGVILNGNWGTLIRHTVDRLQSAE